MASSDGHPPYTNNIIHRGRNVKLKIRLDNNRFKYYIIIMRNEITIKEINGVKVMKIRGKTKSPAIMRDKTKYNRKDKHKGRFGC